MQALDVELQEAEDLQLEAHSTHMQTLDSLVQMQRGRIDAAVLKYEEDRKVNAFIHHMLVNGGLSFGARIRKQSSYPVAFKTAHAALPTIAVPDVCL